MTWLTARIFDRQGKAWEIDVLGIQAWSPDLGMLWVHLDRNVEDSCDWVRSSAALDPLIAEALLDEETRPRTRTWENGQLVILRGVNLNPGAEPEDMVGLRLWVEENRVITVRYRHLMAIDDVLDRFQRGVGPRTSGEFLAIVAERLIDRMNPVVRDLSQRIDAIEQQLTGRVKSDLSDELRQARNSAIILRRYLAPQRDVILRLSEERHSWLSVVDKSTLAEVANEITRFVEELDETRERAVVVQDEIVTRISDAANQRIYILTIISAIMLPLSFITGLLGINVAGLPGTEDGSSFWVVCLVLLVFGAIEYWILRKLKWI